MPCWNYPSKKQYLQIVRTAPQEVSKLQKELQTKEAEADMVRQRLTQASETLAAKLDALSAARKASQELHDKIVAGRTAVEVQFSTCLAIHDTESAPKVYTVHVICLYVTVTLSDELYSCRLYVCRKAYACHL